MISLFIDTSSSDVSIAILEDNKILSSIVKSIPNRHSDCTVSLLSECVKNCNLTPSDIQKIMVVTGPGSFTGLRIGVTIAKVYAYVLNIAIVPVSSLKMRAISLEHQFCLSLIDARNDNYYIGLYDEYNHNIIEERFTDKGNVLKIIDKYHPVIVSDNNGVIGEYSYQRQELNISKIVEYYQNEKFMNPHLVNPNYLKLPQALEDVKK